MHDLVLSDRRNRCQESNAGRVFLSRMAVFGVAVLLAAWADSCGPGAGRAEAAGQVARAAASEQHVEVPPGTALDFYTVEPCRLLDTRDHSELREMGCSRPAVNDDGDVYPALGCPFANGECSVCTWVEFPGGRIEARTRRTPVRQWGPPKEYELVPGLAYSFPVTGRCGVPADAAALVVNATVVDPGGLGYLNFASNMDRINDQNQMLWFKRPARDAWGNVVPNPVPDVPYNGPTRAQYMTLYVGADRNVVVAGYHTQNTADMADGWDLLLDVVGFYLPAPPTAQP